MKFYETQKRMNLNDLQGTRIDIVGGYSQQSGEFDHDAAGALDAQDGAFDSLERAVDDADLLSFAELVGYVLEVEGIVGHDPADLHEVFHGLVAYHYRFTGVLVPDEMSRTGLPHLVETVTEPGLCRADETEIGNSWNYESYSLAILDDFLTGHWYEMLNSDLLKTGAELQYPAIRYPYREPMYSLILRHNAKVRYLLDFTKATGVEMGGIILTEDWKYADLIPHILYKSVEFIPQFVIFA